MSSNHVLSGRSLVECETLGYMVAAALYAGLRIPRYAQTYRRGRRQPSPTTVAALAAAGFPDVETAARALRLSQSQVRRRIAAGTPLDVPRYPHLPHRPKSEPAEPIEDL